MVVARTHTSGVRFIHLQWARLQVEKRNPRLLRAALASTTFWLAFSEPPSNAGPSRQLVRCHPPSVFPPSSLAPPLFSILWKDRHGRTWLVFLKDGHYARFRDSPISQFSTAPWIRGSTRFKKSTNSWSSMPLESPSCIRINLFYSRDNTQKEKNYETPYLQKEARYIRSLIPRILGYAYPQSRRSLCP